MKQRRFLIVKGLNSMDPNVLVELLIESHDNGDYDEAAEYAKNLVEWLINSGFPPQLSTDQMIFIFECLRDSFKTCGPR